MLYLRLKKVKERAKVKKITLFLNHEKMDATNFDFALHHSGQLVVARCVGNFLAA
jgi:hypothetical protein